MFMSSSVGAGFHVSAVVLAIVALSPAPLALPSGIAVAVIGLMGAVAVLTSPAAPPWQPSLVVAPLRTNADDVTVGGRRPRDESGARA
jgi:hypothetical protein